MNIAIIGAGAWGTALAISLSANHRVTLLARDAAQIKAMRATRHNQRYLPDVALPAKLELSADLPAALAAAELVIIAVPIAAFRATLQQLDQSSYRPGVVWVCKGLESETSKLPHQVVAEELPEG